MKVTAREKARATRRRAVALLAAVALTLTACGARVAPYMPVASANVSSGGGAGNGSPTNAGGSVNPATGGATTGGATTGGAPSSGGSKPAAAGASATATGPAGGSAPAAKSSSGGASSPASGSAPVTVASLTPQNFSYNPQQQAAYCTGTSGNTASAPGITPSTIDVGNVSGLTGAVSDSFTPGPQAAQALFAAINRFGGICGRQLKLDVEDDQQSSSSNASDVQYLIPKVFAFVGSLSDADNGGVPAMVSAGIPDMGPVINVNRSNSPVYWSATGGSVTVKNGQSFLGDGWLQGLKQFGQLPKSVAILGYSIPISALAAKQYGTVFQKLGVSICYENTQIQPAPGATMGSIVATMQQKNCDGVFTTMDVVGNGDMLQDMASDGYHPKLISTTYEGYTPAQISLAGGSQNAQNLNIGLSSVPLGSNVPGIQIYTELMNTFQPGQPLTEFGLESWADAELFVYALLKAGRNPTRASLVAALNSVRGWTSDGAFGAYTPSNRTGPPCATDVVYSGSAFKQAWPASGLYCNNHFVPVPSS